MYSNETKIYVVAVAGIIILSGILTAYFAMLVRHQREMAASYKRQINVEINTLENERKRIAFDLHDDLGPFLSSMKLRLNLLHTTDPRDIVIVGEVGDYISEIVQRIRDISNELMPQVLMDRGLQAAVEHLAGKVNASDSLKVITHFPEPLCLPVTTELHLFRIFQETLNNSIKHASATRYYFLLRMHQNSTSVLIEDDGIGFEDKLPSTGAGLKNIASRVDILNGVVYSETSPGNGVKFIIKIPVIHE